MPFFLFFLLRPDVYSLPAALKEAGKVGEKICICLWLGEYVPFLPCCGGCIVALALLRCMLNSTACKMWVCVLVGEQ